MTMLHARALIFIALAAAGAPGQSADSGKTPDVDYDTLAGDLPEIVVAGSIPYYVAGDIYVPPGKTVRIEPGAMFLFKNFTGLQIQGKLFVKGTAQQPVTFTSENDQSVNRHETPEAAPFDWNGVYIHMGGAGTELEHCAIQYSVDGLVSETRFIRLSRCLFRSNGRANVTIEGVEHDAVQEPYSYEIAAKGALVDGVQLSVLRNPEATRRAILRYSGVALAVGGAAMGIVFSGNFSRSSGDLDALSSIDAQNLSDYSSVDWDIARGRKRRDLAGMLCGWGIMIAGGVGMTVSFRF